MTLEELKMEAHKMGYVLKKPATRHKLVCIDEYGIVCDEKIAPLVYFLNDQGWKTHYSCQGHNRNGTPGAYIMIKDLDPVKAKTLMTSGPVKHGVIELRPDVANSKLNNETRCIVTFRRDSYVTLNDSEEEKLDDIWIHDMEKKFGLTDDQIEQCKQCITDWKGEIL